MNIAVVSAKGGVGKSTFCVCVGQALSAHGKKTLLVDMDVGVRSLDLLLGVAEKTVYNWGDVLNENCDAEKAVIQVKENLYLLPAPLYYGDGFDEERFLKLALKFEEEFDFVIFDSPAGIERGFKLSLLGAKSSVVISTPDPVSVRAATGAAILARESGINDVRFVINRFSDKYGKICIDDYIDEIGARLLGVVPESRELLVYAAKGRLKETSEAHLSFLRIAGRLSGEDIPLKMY